MINRIKIFFCFPELLLIIATCAAWMIVAYTTIDLEFNHFYYVFGCYWSLNTLFIPIVVLQTITWVCHLICRKYKSLPVIVRWIQVAFTLICLAVLVHLLSSPLMWRSGAGFDGFNEPALTKYTQMTHELDWLMLIFITVQVLFWISTVIATIREVWVRKK